jgi:hypothetical protein
MQKIRKNPSLIKRTQNGWFGEGGIRDGEIGEGRLKKFYCV